MKKHVPYTFHKWSVYVKEWFQERIRLGIGEEPSWLVPFSEAYKGCNGIYVKNQRAIWEDK